MKFSGPIIITSGKKFDTPYPAWGMLPAVGSDVPCMAKRTAWLRSVLLSFINFDEKLFLRMSSAWVADRIPANHPASPSDAWLLPSTEGSKHLQNSNRFVCRTMKGIPGVGMSIAREGWIMPDCLLIGLLLRAEGSLRMIKKLMLLEADTWETNQSKFPRWLTWNFPEMHWRPVHSRYGGQRKDTF